MPIKITLTPAFEPPVMLPFIWTLILFMLGKLLSTTVIKLASLSFVGIANAKFIEFTKEITVDTSSWRKVSTDSDNPINLHCVDTSTVENVRIRWKLYWRFENS